MLKHVRNDGLKVIRAPPITNPVSCFLETLIYRMRKRLNRETHKLPLFAKTLHVFDDQFKSKLKML